MAKCTDKQLIIHARVLAVKQARGFFDVANTIVQQIQTSTDKSDGNVLKITYATNAAFAAELYLKAIMIMGRNGKMFTGHNLHDLYCKFPSFLKMALEENYTKYRASTPEHIEQIALTLGGDTPPLMPQAESIPPSFDTFDNAMRAISTMFVDSRYIFEKMNVNEWIYVVFAPDPIYSLLQSLDDLYVQFERGDFRQNPTQQSDVVVESKGHLIESL